MIKSILAIITLVPALSFAGTVSSSSTSTATASGANSYSTSSTYAITNGYNSLTAASVTKYGTSSGYASSSTSVPNSTSIVNLPINSIINMMTMINIKP